MPYLCGRGGPAGGGGWMWMWDVSRKTENMSLVLCIGREGYSK